MREYTKDEQRVCDYIQHLTEKQIGCGDDPIGWLLASHAYLVRTLDVWSLNPEQCTKPLDPNKVSDFNLTSREEMIRNILERFR